ncbi:MAG: DNA helicase RecQ [Crocinitomicaceae bacterium]
MTAIQSKLKEVFGYDTFRGQQEIIIKSVLSGRDTMVLMPTGGGKSICYQIPALVLSGITVVVSPLIALMKDQVESLKQYGVKAAFLNSTLSVTEFKSTKDLVLNGEVKLLYVSPERLFYDNASFISFLKTLNVSLFAIDEAHCISHWGHDFRPEYTRLKRLKKHFPDTPVIALTATADERTSQDIQDSFKINAENVFIDSFDRKNLYYEIQEKRDSTYKLIEFLRKKEKESGVIYVISRKKTEELAETLQLNGFDALPYHAGLDRETRDQNQNLFLRDECKIIVATIAFGMGIDKSNVRFVVHMNLPKNIESYYQETGRAGRDGLPSECLLFYSRGDVAMQRSFIDSGADENQNEIMREKLEELVRFCESLSCRRKNLLAYFNETLEHNCGNCDNCNKEIRAFDGTEIAQKALSAVYRLKEGFGLNYVIDFLRGSKSKKIRPEHFLLKTYGAGQDLSKEQWNTFLNELIDQDLLKLKKGRFPTLSLTPKSVAVLKGIHAVQLSEIEQNEHIQQKVLEYDEKLYEMIRVWRKERADKLNIPAFNILSDKTLVELSYYLPLSKSDLLQINGLGHVKVETYGDELISIINDFAQSQGVDSKMHSIGPKRSKSKSIKGTLNTSILETNKLWQNGNSIDEIAEMRNFSPRTIESHLATLVELGEINILELVLEDRIQTIENTFEELGVDALRPVKDKLGDDFSYAELKYVKSNLVKNEKENFN